MTIYDWTKTPIASSQFTISAAGEITKNSSPSDLNVPDKSNGFGMFSHNGPPGAIIADEYMISSTGIVVTYAKFEGSSTREPGADERIFVDGFLGGDYLPLRTENHRAR